MATHIIDQPAPGGLAALIERAEDCVNRGKNGATLELLAQMKKHCDSQHGAFDHLIGLQGSVLQVKGVVGLAIDGADRGSDMQFALNGVYDTLSELFEQLDPVTFSRAVSEVSHG